jgi:hypothetical protein
MRWALYRITATTGFGNLIVAYRNSRDAIRKASAAERKAFATFPR